MLHLLNAADSIYRFAPLNIHEHVASRLLDEADSPLSCPRNDAHRYSLVESSNAASNFPHKRYVSDQVGKVQGSLKSGPPGARSDTKRSRFLNVSLSRLCPNWVSFEAKRPISYRLLATHLSRTDYIFPRDIIPNMK